MTSHCHKEGGVLSGLDVDNTFCKWWIKLIYSTVMLQKYSLVLQSIILD